MLSIGVGLWSRQYIRRQAEIVSYLIDSLSVVPTAAYGTRLLRAGFSGACMRVRRSGDNMESDIGFNGGDLDTTSLLTFVGANTGYVAAWYDQSGNGRDLTMTSAGEQLQIAASGAVIQSSGRPALLSTSKHYLNLPSKHLPGLLQGGTGGTISALFTATDASLSQSAVYISVNGVNADRHSIGYSSGVTKTSVRLSNAG